MNIPQELVDEILNYLPQDQLSLRNCSLVAKLWVNPSRRHIFESVIIENASRRLWLDRISPSNIDLLWHVRSLSLMGSNSWEWGLSFKYTNLDDLYAYFPSLHRLHTIDLCDTRISSDIPKCIEMFSACQQSLSSLIFTRVSLRWRSFIALIDYFPNLRNLGLLQYISFGGTNEGTPPLSRPLRGKISIHLSEEDLAALSRWFAGLEVEYEELMIDVCYVSGTHSQRVITACEKTLRFLEFVRREYLMPWAMLRTSANQILKLVSLQLSIVVQNSANWCSSHHIHK